ncbi:MAG: hypothetical protein U0572_13155 [Phycisphaerales bacterium]
MTLLDPGVEWLVGNRERMDQATADRIMRELSGEARASRRLILGGLALVGLLTVAAIIALAISIVIEGRSALQDAVGSLVFTGPAVTLMLFVGVVGPIAVARKRRLTRSCEVMLRNGHCPHCGYRIAEVPSQPRTGHTICPECGCEWAAPNSQT